MLTAAGQEHNQAVAEKECFAHVEPDGDAIKDRYDQRGLLPECELSIAGANHHCAGAVTIAQLHADSRPGFDWAKGGTYTVYGERDVAWAVVQIGMH